MRDETSIISSFMNKKILLIGDSILDIFVYGTAIGKSSETPTVIAKELETKISYGGASFVARNILELGGRLKFITLIGGDEEARIYSSLEDENLDKYFVSDLTRRTTSELPQPKCRSILTQ